jgi:gluconokinase
MEITAQRDRAMVSGQEADRPLVLAVDIGTSSVRAALFDARGRELDESEFRIARGLTTTAEGGSEIDPDLAVTQVMAALDGCISRLNSSEQIAAVGISCFWHGMLGVDREFRAITPMLSWADTRAAGAAVHLRHTLNERQVHLRTGALFHPSYWPAKIKWIKAEDHTTYRNVHKWLSLSDYLFLKLFGSTKTSVSMASGTGLLNRFDCDWDSELLAALSLDRKKLPEIADDRESFTQLTAESVRRWPQLATAKWYPAIGDGAANNVGTGCVTPDRVALMIGTSGAMRLLYEGEAPRELPEGLWCYRLDRRRVVIGGALSDGGGLFEWMVETLAIGGQKDLTTSLAELAPDSHGLTVLPFWAGERSTGWHENARGAMLGFTLHTTPVDMVRAALESVAYRFAEISERLLNQSPNATIIGSGGALKASPVWAQIICDVIGKRTVLSEASEASSRGAALYALESLGAVADINEFEAPLGRAFEPDSDHHQVYRRALERQRALYERLIADDGTALIIKKGLMGKEPC